MLFWTRVSLCVGAVTVLAIQRLPSAPVPPPGAPRSWAAELASAACRTHPDACAAALAHGWPAVLPGSGAATQVRRKPATRENATPRPVAIAGHSLT